MYSTLHTNNTSMYSTVVQYNMVIGSSLIIVGGFGWFLMVMNMITVHVYVPLPIVNQIHFSCNCHASFHSLVY